MLAFLSDVVCVCLTTPRVLASFARFVGKALVVSAFNAHAVFNLDEPLNPLGETILHHKGFAAAFIVVASIHMSRLHNRGWMDSVIFNRHCRPLCVELIAAWYISTNDNARTFFVMRKKNFAQNENCALWFSHINQTTRGSK
jgi:hypothetical protein